MSLDQAELDLESISNTITTLENQKDDLEKEKKQASKDEQYSYTVQIQAVELQIKTEEYNAETKEQEIDKLEESLQNAEVYSEVEGVVKEVNETPATDANGQPKPFISVLSSGQFRVKGTVSELNIGSLYQGQAVTIHSRVDDTQVWQGVIETIETEPTDDTTNGGVIYYGVDSGQQSSKYNFYVTLSSLDGLILGQHVYIQPDMGLSDLPEGLWLPAFYIAHDDDGSYVWAQNDQGALEKRAVILGEYDSDNDRYQIESGLTEDDYITMPTEGLEEGNPTTSDITQVAPEDPAGDSAVDGGTADGGVMDDGMVDPGMGVTMEESVPEDTGDSTDAAEDAASDSLEGSPMEGLAR